MKQTFSIVGMHCAGCANSLTKAISKVNGVKDVSVTYASDKTTIEYDEYQIDWESLKSAVASVGNYKIVLPDDAMKMEHKTVINTFTIPPETYCSLYNIIHNRLFMPERLLWRYLH